jgi:hypothetical protein
MLPHRYNNRDIIRRTYWQKYDVNFLLSLAAIVSAVGERKERSYIFIHI